ncbi:tyrosinase family oxidase copper chaperone [Streptomyces sp. NPDC005900]|uniref:tyrosinase family oxidase copper chaperone n=1 Tax=unclassified Streptomyces TaxID=2593676 RepID=UPI0033F7B326
MLSRVAPLPGRVGDAPRQDPPAAPDASRLIDRVRRRHLLAVAGAAVLAGAGIFRAARTPDEASAPSVPDDLPFEEMYRGRHIRGEPAAHTDAHAPGWRVTVDGRPLGLMRRADGGYLSTLDHFASYATPLAAARSAVDELGPVQALSGRGH